MNLRPVNFIGKLVHTKATENLVTSLQETPSTPSLPEAHHSHYLSLFEAQVSKGEIVRGIPVCYTFSVIFNL